jgi:hypothetical protein
MAEEWTDFMHQFLIHISLTTETIWCTNLHKQVNVMSQCQKVTQQSEHQSKLRKQR